MKSQAKMATSSPQLSCQVTLRRNRAPPDGEAVGPSLPASASPENLILVKSFYHFIIAST